MVDFYKVMDLGSTFNYVNWKQVEVYFHLVNNHKLKSLRFTSTLGVF